MKTDVVILGSGPAGIQAAIHAARKKAGVIVLGRPEKSAINGAHVENYCCTEETLKGVEMVDDGVKQAQKFGAIFINEDAVEAKGLEGSFMGLTTPQATLAYAESLVAVEYIRDTYGMSDVPRILERLSQGSSIEVALRTTIHSDYAQLHDDLARWLKDKYGL